MAYVYENTEYIIADQPYMQQEIPMEPIPLQMNMGDPYVQNVNMADPYLQKEPLQFIFEKKESHKFLIFAFACLIINVLFGGFSLLLAIKSIKEKNEEIRKKCRQSSVVIGIIGIVITLIVVTIMLPVKIKYDDKLRDSVLLNSNF
ncbi:hypothetical protein A3Q56_04969 [Intoshia linei]|uniref:Uncharacterized protein n=1 Tax=Intoshia linei TaxID=1819745 RepID=A0A177B0M8_9BILA|nr:hypothetical protein A3Q56_04969 [Intoshia linei]